jgi:hypothetical protein
MKPKRKPVNRQGERNIQCAHYGVCLDDAVKRQWQHWECSECAYRSAHESRDAVRTVPDPNVCYELPSQFARQAWHR